MALIHILDKQTDEILGTLKFGQYTDDVKITTFDNQNTFDFTSLKHFDILEKRNRLLLQNRDGYFNEYIIEYSEQITQTKKMVKSNGSYIDLRKARAIEPQTLQGATAGSATDEALKWTEWKAGNIAYAGIRSIVIEEYTNPYDLLKQIASEFGLEIRFRIEIKNGNEVVRYVDMYFPETIYDGKEVEFGKDLVGLRRKEDSKNIITALLGIGPEREDGTRLTILVEDTDALQRWGRSGQHLIDIYEPQSEDQDMTLDRLKTLTTNELKKRIESIVEYECDAVILDYITGREHEGVSMADTIRVKDDGYTPPLYLEARVIELEEKPSIERINKFKLGNYKEYRKEDLESQIAGLKKQVSDRLSKLVQVSITSSSGSVFKNGVGETTLTAVTILGGKEVDTDGTLYTYTWSKYDKDGNFAGATTGKSITVYAQNIDEKETYIVTIENQGAKSIGQITVTNVSDGEQGPPGKSSYTHVAYANSEDGKTDFSLTDSNREYIGMYVDSNPVSSNDPSKYKWTLVKGADGAQGIQGPPGADGRTPYLHIAYANSADGRTGFSTTDSANKLYIGQYTDFTPADSTDPAKYSWTLIKGDKGEDGYTPVKGVDYFDGKDGQDGKSSYLWVKYSVNSNGNPMTDNPAGALYIGVTTTTTPTAPTSYTAYKWSLIKGADGIPGEKGQDGRTSYLHIRYSNDGGKTFTANNGETVGAWMGSYVDFTQADSTNPADYTWNKVKGEQGPQGLQGPPGADGKSLYTWVKYADDINGNGMSDYPDGKKYIGLAYNKTTPTESTNSADYTWALIQGPQGIKGSDGQQLYTWLKYADSPTSGMSDDPTGKKYMGIAYNKTTPTESTNYADYSWSLIKGEKGDKGDKGDQGPQGLQGIQGPKGDQGIQGPPGKDGKSSYTHIAYANSADGATDFSTSDSANKSYIGMYVDFNPTDSNNPASYNWTLIKGQDGAQGIQGPKGADGKTPYLHIAYATNSTGTSGFSTTDPNGKTYIGTYTDYTQADSTDPSKYTWVKIQGPQGPQGVQGPKGADGQTLYTWIKYADSPTSGMSDTPNGKKYIGLAYNKTTPTESSNYADYSWSLIQGPQGVQGPKGADGVTTYTWVKYADDDMGTGMSDSPNGKRYLGLAYNKTTPTESTNPNDYSWSPLYDNVIPGGKNLILKSNTKITTTGYLIKEYDLSENLVAGQSYVFVIKGAVPSGQKFGIWMNGGNNNVGYATSQYSSGVTFVVFKAIAPISGKEKKLSLYNYPNNTTSATVEWVALYKGNVPMDWTEAPEDTQAAIDQAKQDAQNAQSTADGKNTAFYQATAPSTVGRKKNDLWYDTDDGYKPYYFNGSSWIPAPFGNAAIANLDAGKITTGYLSAARIAAKSIDVSKLNVSTLSAITANLGNITAGNISGVNITGVTITGSTINGGSFTAESGAFNANEDYYSINLDASGLYFVTYDGQTTENLGETYYRKDGIVHDTLLGSTSEFTISSNSSDGIRISADTIRLNGDIYLNGDIKLTPGSTYTTMETNELRVSRESYTDPAPNISTTMKVDGGFAARNVYVSGRLNILNTGIELTWPNGTPYIDFARRSGVDFDMRIMLDSSSNINFMSSDGVTRHRFSPSGTKAGGTIEIDGEVLGMSPIDSPQILLETIEFDVPLTEQGTKVLLDSRFAKAVNYRFAVFQNNGRVIEKGPDYFIISGDGLADIRIVGERVGYAGVYFDDMTVEGAN